MKFLISYTALVILVLSVGVAGTLDKSLDSGGASSNLFMGIVGLVFCVYFWYLEFKDRRKES